MWVRVGKAGREGAGGRILQNLHTKFSQILIGLNIKYQGGQWRRLGGGRGGSCPPKEKKVEKNYYTSENNLHFDFHNI